MPEVNLYFQDESRFGLMTSIGKCLTAKGVKPVVTYKHTFKSTYLYGCFSPINGDSFLWEIDKVNTKIFEAFLHDFSLQKPQELKIIVIDNAGFHSTKHITIPDNIVLIRIPPYSPELNPAEKMWQFFKRKFRNKTFNTIEELKLWLHKQVEEITNELVASITATTLYNNNFMTVFK